MTTTEIILCTTCKGSSIVEVLDSKHVVEYIKCPNCSGSGRLIKTVETTFQPYVVNTLKSK